MQIPARSAPVLPRQNQITSHPAARAVYVLVLLYVFLSGVKGLSSGFESLGEEYLDTFFQATSNPFLGLIIGVLMTTLVQSSSVTTSLIVAAVAAPVNPLPVVNAVPMVMGANIGTTVTCTIVSMAHMGRKEEFRRAFAVACCHDFFNISTVALLLPLEIATGYLRHTAHWIASHVTGVGGVQYESPLDGALKAGRGLIESVLVLLTDSERLQGALLILVSAVMIYAALLLLVRTMRKMLAKRVEGAVSGALDRNPLLAMTVGMIVTAMVQSSSITTSLLVPLGGAGVITLAQAFPVTIGANVGTTVTALLASMAVSGVNAEAGVTIALVHLLFNVSGTALIYPVKRIRRIPLGAARWLADTAARSRWLALTYVALMFYILPAILAIVSRR